MIHPQKSRCILFVFEKRIYCSKLKSVRNCICDYNGNGNGYSKLNKLNLQLHERYIPLLYSSTCNFYFPKINISHCLVHLHLYIRNSANFPSTAQISYDTYKINHMSVSDCKMRYSQSQRGKVVPGFRLPQLTEKCLSVSKHLS